MRSRAERIIIGAFVFVTALLTVGYVAALDEGSRAPAFQLQTLDGERVSLQSLRGKVVVVDFWASWCEPCGEAMPALDRIYRRYKNNGLVVVGVNVDDEASAARQFLQNTSVSFPVAHDAGKRVANQYSPPTMPTSFIIDKQGVVRHVHAGYRDGDARTLEQQIRELL